MADINEVIERVRSDLNYAVDITRDKDVKFPIHAGDATKLLDEIMRLQTCDNWSVMDHERMQAELETVRAERDAALGAVADAMTTFRNIVRSIPTDAPRDDLEQHYLHGCKHGAAYAQGWLNRHENALNTQPQAEWTPREGKRVQLKETGERGFVFKIFEGYERAYRVEFKDGGYADYAAKELAPVDESEA